MSQKMGNVLKRIFGFPDFLVRFLVFEIWLILYSTVINSELGLTANLIQTLTSEFGDSIQKHLGPGRGAHGGGFRRAEPP